MSTLTVSCNTVNTRGRWRNMPETILACWRRRAHLIWFKTKYQLYFGACVFMKSVAYSWLSMRFISSVMLSDPGTSSSEVLGSASISEFSSSDTALRSFLLLQAMAPWKAQRPFASTENLIHLMIRHIFGNLEHAEVYQILSKRPNVLAHFQW